MTPFAILIATTVPVVWGMRLVFAEPTVSRFPPVLLMAPQAPPIKPRHTPQQLF